MDDTNGIKACRQRKIGTFRYNLRRMTAMCPVLHLSKLFNYSVMTFASFFCRNRRKFLPFLTELF